MEGVRSEAQAMIDRRDDAQRALFEIAHARDICHTCTYGMGKGKNPIGCFTSEWFDYCGMCIIGCQNYKKRETL